MTTRGRIKVDATRFGRALLYGALVVALATGFVLQGARFFSCEMMGVRATPCCAAHQTVDHGTTAQMPDCCHVARMPGVPAGALAVAAVVPQAALVAMVPATHPVISGAPPPPRFADRARGPPPLPDRLHARLMIFLT